MKEILIYCSNNDILITDKEEKTSNFELSICAYFDCALIVKFDYESKIRKDEYQLIENMTCCGSLKEKINSFFKMMCKDDRKTVKNVYFNYGIDYCQGFLSGVASYLCLIFLIKKSTLQLNLCGDEILNRNYMKYFRSVLILLIRTCKGWILQLSLYVQNFLNIWELIFVEGEVIDPCAYTNLMVDIMICFQNKSSIKIKEYECGTVKYECSKTIIEINSCSEIKNNSLYEEVSDFKIKDQVFESKFESKNQSILSLNSNFTIKDNIVLKESTDSINLMSGEDRYEPIIEPIKEVPKIILKKSTKKSFPVQIKKRHQFVRV